MSTEYLVDTNILIYHTRGSQVTEGFISKLLTERSLQYLDTDKD